MPSVPAVSSTVLGCLLCSLCRVVSRVGCLLCSLCRVVAGRLGDYYADICVYNLHPPQALILARNDFFTVDQACAIFLSPGYKDPKDNGPRCLT